MKLGLGTVQFGLDYGISNKTGRTEGDEVARILGYALEQGIQFLDTAANYGQSEAVIGKAISETDSFLVVTKLPPLRDGMVTQKEITFLNSTFEKSLTKIGKPHVYGLLMHHAEDLLTDDGEKVFELLQDYKSRGLVKKIGVSVYDKATLERVLDRFSIDLIQIPLNIFDQRMYAGGYLKQLKQMGIEIHVRSVFLQGLLLMPPNDLSAGFVSVVDHIKDYRTYISKRGLSPIQAALGFVLSIEEVDVALCGVNNLQQLTEISDLARDNKVLAPDFEKFAVLDEKVITPSLWNT